MHIPNNNAAILYSNFQHATCKNALDASFVVDTSNPNECSLIYKLMFMVTLFEIVLLAFRNVRLSLCRNVE